MHDLTNLTNYYDRLVAGHDDDRAAVGWHTSYAQDVAFLSLTALDGLVDGVSVLDLGCGLGAMKTFFDRRGLAVRYTGYDISSKMVEGARGRHPDVRFEVRDILKDPPKETFDFVLASGLLTYRVGDQGQYTRDMIRRMYALCDTAMAFNLLSGYTFLQSPALQRDANDLDYGWPDVTYRFCKMLAKHVVINQASDARGYDVVLYKRNRAALRRYLEYARPGRIYGPAVQAAIDYHGELGLFEEMRDFLLTLEPCVQVLSALGGVYATLGDNEKARATLTLAVASDAKYALPHINLGRIALADRDLTGAIDHFGRALIADATHPLARDELVRALLKAGRKGEARKAIAKLPAGAHASLLSALCGEDDAAAEVALLQALTVAPRYLEALVQIAFLYERMGRRSDALTAWKRAQQSAPIDKSIADRIVALEGRS